MPRIDTSNRYIVVGLNELESLAMLRPPMAATRIAFDDAVNLAAWLVLLTPNGEKRLAAALREIKNT